jgi:hypothetical protein
LRYDSMPQIGRLQPDSMEDRRRKACFLQRKTTKAVLVMQYLCALPAPSPMNGPAK